MSLKKKLVCLLIAVLAVFLSGLSFYCVEASPIDTSKKALLVVSVNGGFGNGNGGAVPFDVTDSVHRGLMAIWNRNNDLIH